VTIIFNDGTLIKVLVTHQHCDNYQLSYPALPRLICNLLSILKMCPSAFGILSPQAQGGVGRGQTFLGQVGMCVENFIQIGAGVWIFISPPHTNRQTHKYLYAHFYIYRLIYPVPSWSCSLSIELDQYTIYLLLNINTKSQWYKMSVFYKIYVSAYIC